VVEHINQLELRAVTTGVRWLLSNVSCIGKRVHVLLDNATAYAAIRKGRCKSSSILLLLRKLTAFVLGIGVRLNVVWCPSAMNPADGPSRVFDSVFQ
jgi:hypothetical protein